MTSTESGEKNGQIEAWKAKLERQDFHFNMHDGAVHIAAALDGNRTAQLREHGIGIPESGGANFMVGNRTTDVKRATSAALEHGDYSLAEKGMNSLEQVERGNSEVEASKLLNTEEGRNKKTKAIEDMDQAVAKFVSEMMGRYLEDFEERCQMAGVAKDDYEKPRVKGELGKIIDELKRFTQDPRNYLKPDTDGGKRGEKEALENLKEFVAKHPLVVVNAFLDRIKVKNQFLKCPKPGYLSPMLPMCELRK